MSTPHALEQLRELALKEIGEANDEQLLDIVRVRYLGRNGRISLWSEQMKTLSKEEKPVVGKLLNEVRTEVTAAIDQQAMTLQSAKEKATLSGIDISLPGTLTELGSIHPL